MNLDSLVDIVSNMVGILVILAVFMALITLLSPVNNSQSADPRTLRKIPEKIMVPWSHPTNKNHLFLALRENRVQVFDLREFYLELANKKIGLMRAPISIKQKDHTIRFFPVTNQIYCLEIKSAPNSGENWLKAQRPVSKWKQALREFPPEKFVLFFWVGTESFGLFRQIRKILWEQNYEVGWKPAHKSDPIEICNGFEGSTTFQPQ
ncbi:MAG: hypothetical protein IIC13_01980 [SAR324 cluster bacterium]|nr:hypothetical protein [SAR324 cluster bacterium]